MVLLSIPFVIILPWRNLSVIHLMSKKRARRRFLTRFTKRERKVRIIVRSFCTRSWPCFHEARCWILVGEEATRQVRNGCRHGTALLKTPKGCHLRHLHKL